MNYIKYTSNRFKKYTGQGLSTMSGVVIDDNGIAKGFNKNNCVKTNLLYDFAKNPFEVNIKFAFINNTVKTALIMSGTALYQTFSITYYRYQNKHYIECSSFKGNSETYIYAHNIQLEDFESPSNHLNEWYYLNIKYTGTKYILSIVKEDNSVYKLQEFEDSTPPDLKPNDYVIFGTDGDVQTVPYSFGKIDLSETYIKDLNTNTIISPWNL